MLPKSPKGIKKKTIESQLKSFKLRNYMGVIMMADENGDGNLVSVEGYDSQFKVSLYKLDKPRYIPYVV